MSGTTNKYHGSFLGVSAEVTIGTCPFTPRTVKFWADAGSAVEVGYKSDQMADDAYLSTSTGTDAGVTLAANGFVVASGADVNVAAAQVFFECED
jgi:hypothetical protein